MAEKKDVTEKKAVTEEKDTQTPVTLTMEELQKVISDAIEKHDLEKQEKSTEPNVLTEEEKREREYYEEKVVVNLFLDNDKYKDDVIVAVNGKAWRIKRGMDVEVPRYVAEVLKHSEEQDRKTALRIREMEQEFEESLR